MEDYKRLEQKMELLNERLADRVKALEEKLDRLIEPLTRLRDEHIKEQMYNKLYPPFPFDDTDKM